MELVRATALVCLMRALAGIVGDRDARIGGFSIGGFLAIMVFAVQRVVTVRSGMVRLHTQVIALDAVVCMYRPLLSVIVGRVIAATVQGFRWSRKRL